MVVLWGCRMLSGHWQHASIQDQTAHVAAGVEGQLAIRSLKPLPWSAGTALAECWCMGAHAGECLYGTVKWADQLTKVGAIIQFTHKTCVPSVSSFPVTCLFAKSPFFK